MRVDPMKLRDPAVIKTFGKNMAVCLELIGSSVHSFAIRADVNSELLERYIVGEGQLTESIIEAVCAELRLPRIDLFSGYGPSDRQRKELSVKLTNAGHITSTELLGEGRGSQNVQPKEMHKVVTRALKDIPPNLVTISWGENDVFGMCSNDATINLREITVRAVLVQNIKSLFRSDGISSFDVLHERIGLRHPVSWWFGLSSINGRIYGTEVDQVAEAFGVSVYSLMTGKGLDAPARHNGTALPPAQREEPQVLPPEVVTESVEPEEELPQEVLAQSIEPEEDGLTWSENGSLATSREGKVYYLADKKVRAVLVGRLRTLARSSSIGSFTALLKAALPAKHQTWLNVVERGNAKITRKELDAIAQVLRVTTYTILCDEGIPLTFPASSKSREEHHAPAVAPKPALMVRDRDFRIVPAPVLHEVETPKEETSDEYGPDLQAYFRLQVLNPETSLPKGVKVGDLLVLTLNQESVDWVNTYLELTAKGKALCSAVNNVLDKINEHAPENQEYLKRIIRRQLSL